MGETRVTITETESGTRFTLWGAPLSVYSAKGRSYLIKKRIPYRELFPSHPDFGSRILPSLGFFVIPVLETPGGEIVQDTSDIIDYLEARFPEPSFVPQTPVQQTVATLLCAFGSEGFNQPSMHYRWSFLHEHGDYIVTEFGRATSPSRGPGATQGHSGAVHRSHEESAQAGHQGRTIPAIETASVMLRSLDALFLHHPYLLGGRPSMADFGFMTGLYAHLSRDPVPSALMKSRAPNVFRWTERMNIANLDDGRFPEAGNAYLPNDQLPEALEPILRLVFSDSGAGLSLNGSLQYLGFRPTPLPASHLVSSTGERAVHPGLGTIHYAFRGVTIAKNVGRRCSGISTRHFRLRTASGVTHGTDGRPCWQEQVESKSCL